MHSKLTLPLILGGVGVCMGLLIAVLFVVLNRTSQPTQIAATAPPTPLVGQSVGAQVVSPVPAAVPAVIQPAAQPIAQPVQQSASQNASPTTNASIPETAAGNAPSQATPETNTTQAPPGDFVAVPQNGYPPGAVPPNGMPPNGMPPGAMPPGMPMNGMRPGMPMGGRHAMRPGSMRPGMPPGMGQPGSGQPGQPGATQPGAASGQPGAAPAQPTSPGNGSANDDSRSLAKGGTREIIDRVGGGIVLINVFDATGRKEAFGSGFLIDASGRVLTNHHVIEHATKATAQFKDGSECDIDGYYLADAKHDLAVVHLKNPPNPLTVLTLAHGADPQQGDDVVAIGHPKGYAFTVTTGIVSAIRGYEDIPDGIREFADLAEDGRWIQTTAPITHGNSGGPLLNARGEVIGVNSWIMHEEGNLAFACHISVIDQCLPQQTSELKPLPAPGGKPAVNSLVGDVLKGFTDEYVKYVKSMRSAGSEVERGRAKAHSPVVAYMQKLLTLADQHRKDKIALEALASACELSTLDKPHAGQILKTVESRLLEDHVEDEKLGDVAILLIKSEPADVKDFLTKLSSQSPHREVKGIATLALVAHQVDGLTGVDKSAEAKVVTLLKRLNSQYADVPIGDKTIGDIADPMLFEVEHLIVGKKAQEIKGKDFDGHGAKLSDFRGNVVVLDFYTDAFEKARELYAHHQEFLRIYKNDPFRILGINVDPLEKGRTTVSLKKVTWPCIWDGPKGPISTRWNVQVCPSNYVIDAKGIIRYRNLYGEDLLRAVEVLLTEMNPSRPPLQVTPQVVKTAPTKSSSTSRSRSSHISPSTRGPRSRIPRPSQGQN
ncbi:MAG TPA: trypsin-like peptidase domain-containing protein [Pirellulales bacterium]